MSSAIQKKTTMSPLHRIESAVTRLAPSSTAVDILATSYTKVLANPQCERFRKVDLSNPIMRSVSQRPGAMELLHATGWEHHYGHLLLNVYNRTLLEKALSALQNVQNSHPAYFRDCALVKFEASRSRETAEREQAEDDRRRVHAQKVPVEPPEGSAGTAQVCIHLDGNKHVWRRFDSTVDTLQDLLNFVKSLKGAPLSPRLENITQIPSLPFDLHSQLGLSLHQLDLWPAGHVRVTCHA